jgi:hypothetical protein
VIKFKQKKPAATLLNLDAAASAVESRPFALELDAKAQPEPAPDRVDPISFGRRAYVFAAIAASVWAGCVVAFAMAYQGRDWSFEFRPAQTVLLILVAGLPSAFVFLLARAFQDGARLAGEARRARSLSDDLVAPAALAAVQAAGVVDVVRAEIDRAVAATEQARENLSSLREALAAETQQISHAAQEAVQSAQTLASALSSERTELSSLSETLGAQAGDIARAIADHTRLVSEASDLAQTQIQEAEAVLAGRAADFAVAAGDARAAAALAAGDLAEQAQKLGHVGDDAAERLGRLWTGLSVERDLMASLLERLKASQDEAAVRLEAQRALLTDAADAAHDSAHEVLAAAREAAEGFKAHAADAALEVENFAQRAQAAHDGLDQSARTTLGLFTSAVADERALLDAEARAAIAQLSTTAAEARAAAHKDAEAVRADIEAFAHTARHRLEELGEAAFAAGQRADVAVDSRIAAARRLIEDSASLVEAAGQATARRVEAAFAPVRGAISDLEALMNTIEQQADRLPEEARARAEQVRKAVEQGVGDLTAAARRAAEETQAIDAAFQERVRQNYEMLNEAVQMMGRVAGAVEEAVQAGESKIEPPTVSPEPAINGSGRGAMQLGLRGALDIGDDEEEEEPVLAFPAAKAPSPLSANGPPPATAVRPRLKLTPTAEDKAVKTVFEGAAGAKPRRDRAAPSPGADGWTWKELLSGMDGDKVDDDVLAERLISEIQALGVDSTALLPRARIDEISRTVSTSGLAAGRALVRRVAPAAVRRLSRRIAEDGGLRRDVEGYVRRYEDLLSEQTSLERGAGMAETLLGSDPGRAFLLLGAAVGDDA